MKKKVKEEITVYEAEKLVGDMMKVKRYERWMSEKGLPQIMKENDYIGKTEEDIMKFRNLGKKSLKELKDKLDSYGLALRGEQCN